jgi:hypothetical protein
VRGWVGVWGLLSVLETLGGLAVGFFLGRRGGGIKFWTSVFSDGPYASFSRVACAFVILVSCSWVSYSIGTHRPLPEVQSLIGSVGSFLAIVLSILYGANKVGSVVSGIKGNQAPPPTPEK